MTPRTLQVHATGVDKLLDGKLNALVKLADNRVAGDTLSISGNASYADMAVGDAKPVTVSALSFIAADGPDARN